MNQKGKCRVTAEFKRSEMSSNISSLNEKCPCLRIFMQPRWKWHTEDFHGLFSGTICTTVRNNSFKCEPSETRNSLKIRKDREIKDKIRLATKTSSWNKSAREIPTKIFDVLYSPLQDTSKEKSLEEGSYRKIYLFLLRLLHCSDDIQQCHEPVSCSFFYKCWYFHLTIHL